MQRHEDGIATQLAGHRETCGITTERIPLTQPRDELAPARGMVKGLAAGIVGWAMIAAVVWLL